MPRFRKLVEKAVKGDEFWLLDNGVEGRAVILSATATSITTTDGGDGQRVYKMRLRVTLPDTEPYEVEHKQWTFDHAPPGGSEIVRVRVDPDDHEHLTIDWRNPLRGLQPSGPSVAEILERGTATKATVRAHGDVEGAEPIDGKPVVFFHLDVVVGDGTTFEAKLAQPVPSELLPTLADGIALPVRYVTPDAEGLAIDWKAYQPS